MLARLLSGLFIVATIYFTHSAFLLNNASAADDDDLRVCGIIAVGSSETIGYLMKVSKGTKERSLCNDTAVVAVWGRYNKAQDLPSGANSWRMVEYHKCESVRKNYFGGRKICNSNNMKRTGKNAKVNDLKVYKLVYENGQFSSTRVD